MHWLRGGKTQPREQLGWVTAFVRGRHKTASNSKRVTLNVNVWTHNKRLAALLFLLLLLCLNIARKPLLVTSNFHFPRRKKFASFRAKHTVCPALTESSGPD